MMIVPDTYFTLSEEVRLFGLSCIGGAVMGAAFDVLRVFRLILRHNDILAAAEDILFFGLYGVALAGFSSAAARGEMRLYFVIGNILGFAVYQCTVGSVVMKTLRKLFNAAGAVFKLISRPFRTFFAPLCKKATVKFVRNLQIIVKPFKKIKIVLLNRQFLLYNKMENKKRKNVNNVVEKNET
ncbi:spore cortex biosynthesis protein YabQ [Ruminococcus sp.]|uniref:spore cortex biosynthesis protein YabQ n=1 Tax=Ruminococcus sp. TaxID=41978 RepID=UPI0025D03513|nr:spore cortex biosynthesis protein YabQ [Ruminococcus sp.]